MPNLYTHFDDVDENRHHIFSPIESGESYHANSLNFAPGGAHGNYGPQEIWEEIEYTAYGDYAGHGSVGIANYNSIKEEMGDDAEDIAFVYGCYGYNAIIYRVNTKNETLKNMIKSLKNYPVLDEMELSKVENEQENDAWISWVCSDFTSELIKAFPDLEDDIKAMDSDAIYQVFHTAMNEANVYWSYDNSGASLCFDDIKRIVACVTIEDLNVEALNEKDS